MRHEYDKTTIAARLQTENIAPNQDIDMNEIYFGTVSKYLDGASNLLDVGTGNGFVLSEIIKRNAGLNTRLYGIDSSESMVSLARKNLAGKADIFLADASKLPFDDGSFDIVVAKNVTRINAEEISRVLRVGGVFIFREYGRGKGLCEIASLFPGRIIRQRDPQFYVSNLTSAGLTIEKLESFRVKRSYNSVEELITIVKSYPFIDGLSDSDVKLIREHCRDAVVTSDPFLLVCRKE